MPGSKEPNQKPEGRRKVAKHSFLKWPLRILKYSFYLIILLLISTAGALYWLTQTESGQTRLIATVNSLLDDPNLGFRITRFSGSLPADFTFDIESADKNGTWLTAARNHIVFNWRKLPKAIVLSEVEAPAIDVSRFPTLPAEEALQKSPPGQPFTIKTLQDYLGLASDFLAEKHWWLPDLLLDNISASVLLPPDLLPGEAGKDQRLQANLGANAAFAQNRLHFTAEVAAQNFPNEDLSLSFLKLQKASVKAALDMEPIEKGLSAKLNITSDMTHPLLNLPELPGDALGPAPRLSLEAAATAKTDPQSLEIQIKGPDLAASLINLSGEGNWHSDASWANGVIAGPLLYNLALSLDPVAQPASLLSAIKEPLSLKFHLDGNLPVVNLSLAAQAPKIEHDGHDIDKTFLTLEAADVSLPLDEISMASLEKENHCTLLLQSNVDQHDIRLETDIFFQAVPGTKNEDWRAGLRNLSLAALGVDGKADAAILFPKDRKPALDGVLNLDVGNWTAINGLLPGQKLDGKLHINASFKSGLPSPVNNPLKALSGMEAISQTSQEITANIDIPTMKLQSGGTTVDVRAFSASAALSDIFRQPAINTKVNVRNITAPPLKIGAQLTAAGTFSGPITAALATTGSINSKVEGQWEPGRAQINTLDILTDLNLFLHPKKGKKMPAGIRSSQAASLAYGKNGLSFSNLDIKIIPSGRLTANGGLAPDKLDLALALNDFRLKPWQVFSPAIPAGIINIAANVSGSPQKPSGNFKINLDQIAIPQTPLKPINVILAGDLTRDSRLNTRLELDPATVKTLGGEVARIDASIPLQFREDGIPFPNMKAPLKAQILWDGALGPIWNLVPVADQRLNGRVAVDITAGGTLTAPQIRGSAGVNHARYENVALGVLLTDINAKLELKDSGKLRDAKGPLGNIPGSMTLAFNLSDGRGGTITGTGRGDLDGSNLDIRTRINRLKPLRRRDVHIELSGHTEVTGTALSPHVGGEIIIDKGEVLLNNISVPGSVTTLPISSPKEKAKPVTASETQNIGSINLAITMLPRFSVEGRGLASIWKANLLVTGPLNDPKISGNISSVRGNFDFLGKNFALMKGIVFFGGGAISNPLVDIDLEYETPDLTAHILVTGPVSKIKLNLSSDPVLPRDEIISRVLFGRSLNDLSRMEALQLAGAVAQLAGFGGGSGILGGMKKALGVDVLRIGTSDTGATGDDNAGGTNIEMGKYINDFIYMGIQQGFQPDSTAFIIDLELTPRANIELRTEQGNTWGGFKWKYNY